MQSVPRGNGFSVDSVDKVDQVDEYWDNLLFIPLLIWTCFFRSKLLSEPTDIAIGVIARLQATLAVGFRLWY